MSWLFYAAVGGVALLAALILLSNHDRTGGNKPHRPQAA